MPAVNQINQTTVEQRQRYALPRCSLGVHIEGWMEAFDYVSGAFRVEKC